MTIIYAMLMFCVLIFVHELGHFITAKACGIKVNEFSLGMGPAVLKKQKGETLYALRIFPIGGFCAMEGEDEESDDERAFNNKAWWQKAIVISAGAIMNFLLAIVLMAALSFAAGTPTTTLASVEADSPAANAGIAAGDKIVSIDNRTVEKWSDVSLFIADADDETVDITFVTTDGAEKTITLTPVVQEGTGRKIIGVVPKASRNIIKAAGDGIRNTGILTVSMLDAIKQLFTGDVPTSELSGPVGIVAVVSTTAAYGFRYLVMLAAIISINLGIVNLLPFPALDGGRLVFILIRAISRGKITDQMEGAVHFVGIMLLFMLMIYVTWNDIWKFIIPIFN